MLARDEGERGGNIVSNLGNRSGALYETLKTFAGKKINLVKLESRPIHGKPWEYMFYVDIEADIESADFKSVLDELEKSTDYLRVLGCY